MSGQLGWAKCWRVHDAQGTLSLKLWLKAQEGTVGRRPAWLLGGQVGLHQE
jgi:hypothetical protein